MSLLVPFLSLDHKCHGRKEGKRIGTGLSKGSIFTSRVDARALDEARAYRPHQSKAARTVEGRLH